MFYALYFFTFWSILLVILHKYTYKHVNLLFITFISLIIGSYISFLHPKYFIYEIDNEKIYLTGLHKFIIIDIFAHILPFLFVYFTYYNYYKNKSILEDPITILIVLIYGIIINHQKIYQIGFREISLILLISICLYFLL